MFGDFIGVMIVVLLGFYPLVDEDQVKYEDVAFECSNLEYELSDLYIESDSSVECSEFSIRGGEGEGPWYSFNDENYNNLEDYELVYEDGLVKAYEFENYESLDGHIFGEVYFKICENLDYGYYLNERDVVVDENLNLVIDVSDHMDIYEFVDVCRSLEIL